MRYFKYFKSSLIAVTLLFALFSTPISSIAQDEGPTGYCNPYSTCYNTADRPSSQGGTIVNVVIYDGSGSVVLENNTTKWARDWDGDGNRC